jgi:protein TonB
MMSLLAFAAAAIAYSGEPPASPDGGRRSYTASVAYPPEALRRGEQGRVEYQLTVSPEGRVSACQVTSSSGSAVLDRATCEIMRTRARFIPAHDDRGNPVADTVRSAMNWVLPD